VLRVVTIHAGAIRACLAGCGEQRILLLVFACLAGDEAADRRFLRADEQVVQAHRPEQAVGTGQAGVAVHLIGDGVQSGRRRCSRFSGVGRSGKRQHERIGKEGRVRTRKGVRCMKGRRSSTEARSSSDRLLCAQINLVKLPVRYMPDDCRPGSVGPLREQWGAASRGLKPTAALYRAQRSEDRHCTH